MKALKHIVTLGLIASIPAFAGLPASGYSKLLDQVRAREATMEKSTVLTMENPLPIRSYSKLLDQFHARQVAANRSNVSSSSVSMICTHSKLLDHVRHMEQIRQILAAK